jgi:hypothetical protein
MYESCNVWTRRESCHIYEGVMSDICHTYGSHVFHVWMSHIWTKCIKRFWRGVATMSRLLKITGLFCRISSFLQGSFAKETYTFKEATNRSHRMFIWYCLRGGPQSPHVSHTWLNYIPHACESRHIHDWDHVTSHITIRELEHFTHFTRVNWIMSTSHMIFIWIWSCHTFRMCELDHEHQSHDVYELHHVMSHYMHQIISHIFFMWIRSCHTFHMRELKHEYEFHEI